MFGLCVFFSGAWNSILQSKFGILIFGICHQMNSWISSGNIAPWAVKKNNQMDTNDCLEDLCRGLLQAFPKWWWFQKIVVFIPTPEEMLQFDLRVFFKRFGSTTNNFHYLELLQDRPSGNQYQPTTDMGFFSRWWFQVFFIFISTWGNHPIWLIFFKWVETTN